jgi:hypothetical protein
MADEKDLVPFRHLFNFEKAFEKLDVGQTFSLLSNCESNRLTLILLQVVLDIFV